MGLLKLPNNYDRRAYGVAPFENMEIDYTHPLTRGMVSCVFKDRELVSGKTIINELPIEVTVDGEMYGYGAGVQLLTRTEDNTEMTLISRARSINSDLNGFIDFASTASNGLVRSRIRSAGTTTINTIVETTDFGFGVFTTTEQEKSFDLVLKGSQTRCEGLNGDVWTSTFTALETWNEFRVVGSTFTGSEIYAPYCYLWNIDLTREECAHIYRNPYELLKPTRNTVYFIPDSSGGITGSIAIIEGLDVIESSGTVVGVKQGSIATIEGLDVIESSGTVVGVKQGSIVTIEDLDVIESSGTVSSPGVVTGSSSILESIDLTESTGTVVGVKQGSIATIEDLDVIESSGTVSSPGVITGSSSILESIDVSESTGTVISFIDGSISIVEGTDQIESVGTVSSPGLISGEIGIIDNNDVSLSQGNVVSILTGSIVIENQNDNMIARGSLGLIEPGKDDISLSSPFTIRDINFSGAL